MPTQPTYYKKLLSLYYEVSTMFEKKIPADAIRLYLTKRLSVIKKKEIFGTVASLRALLGWVDLNFSIKKIQDFILARRHDVNIVDIWQMIEITDQNWAVTASKGYTGGYNEIARIGILNVEVAVPILLVLDGQKKVEARVLEGVRQSVIGPHVVLAILNYYFNREIHVEKYNSTVFLPGFFSEVNYDFTFQLLRHVFDTMPGSFWMNMREQRDRLLEQFRDFYLASPYGLSQTQLNALLQDIRAVSDDDWQQSFQLSRQRALTFINKQYQYHFEGHDHSLVAYDDLNDKRDELRLLSRILIQAKYKRKLKDQMDNFIENHPISLYWQVRMMAEDDETEGKAVRKFIEDHLNEFSYEELLKKVISTYVSERIQYALYIILKMKGPEKVLEDIIKNYRAGNIAKPELEYLLYSCGGGAFYLGTLLDNKFHTGLKRFVEGVG